MGHSHTYYRDLVVIPIIAAIIFTSLFSLLVPMLGTCWMVCLPRQHQLQYRPLIKMKSVADKWLSSFVKMYFYSPGLLSKRSSSNSESCEDEEEQEEFFINDQKVNLFTMALLSLYVLVAAVAIISIVWLSLFIQVTYTCDDQLDCFNLTVTDTDTEFDVSATPVNSCSTVSGTTSLIMCYRHGINPNVLVEVGGLYTTFKLIPAVYSVIILKLYYWIACLVDKCNERIERGLDFIMKLLKLYYYALGWGCFLTATNILGILLIVNENYHLYFQFDIYLKIFWVIFAIFLCTSIPWEDYISPRKKQTTTRSQSYGSIS